MLSPISNRDMIDIHRQQGLAQALARTQIQISTGKKLARGSDDPIASSRIGQLQRSQADSSAWQANLEHGLAANNAAGTIAQALSETISSARESVLSGANGATSVADRELLARQLEGMADSIDRLALRKDASGQPLFRTDGAIMVRFAEDTVLAPVPARDALFSVGGTAIATWVRDAATALRSGLPAATDLSLDQLDRAVASVSDATAQIGLTGSELEILRNRTSDLQVELAVQKSGLEDTDLTEAIARLNQQTLTLEAAQAAFARLNRQTLFDIIG